jgi:hypothetical protein
MAGCIELSDLTEILVMVESVFQSEYQLIKGPFGSDFFAVLNRYVSKNSGISCNVRVDLVFLSYIVIDHVQKRKVVLVDGL